MPFSDFRAHCASGARLEFVRLQNRAARDRGLRLTSMLMSPGGPESMRIERLPERRWSRGVGKQLRTECCSKGRTESVRSSSEYPLFLSNTVCPHTLEVRQWQNPRMIYLVWAEKPVQMGCARL